MTCNVWSVEKEEYLIELWEERSCLYDTSSRDYNNRVKKAKAWEEISFALEVPGKQVFFIQVQYTVWYQSYAVLTKNLNKCLCKRLIL